MQCEDNQEKCVIFEAQLSKYKISTQQIEMAEIIKQLST